MAKYTWQETYDLAKSQGLSDEVAKKSADNWANMGGKDRPANPATPGVVTTTPSTVPVTPRPASGPSVNTPSITGASTTPPISKVSTSGATGGNTDLNSIIKTMASGLTNGGYGLNLRDWAKANNFGVNYDAGSGMVQINGKPYAVGAIPGTMLDSKTGQHIITNGQQLLDTLNAAAAMNGLYSDVTADLYEPAPTLADIMSQLTPYLPANKEYSVLSYDDAMKQAGDQISPLYEIQTRDLLNKLATDQIGRGFYGQLPADVVTSEAVAGVQANKNSDIAKLASSLVDQSQENAYRQQELDATNRGQTLDALMSALTQSMNAHNQRVDNILGMKQSMDQEDQFQMNYGLDKKTTEAQIALDQMNAALTRTDTLGYVLPQDAAILGVAAGTPSWKAKEAAADRAAQFQLAAMSRSSSGGGKKTAAQTKAEQQAELSAQIKNVQAKYGCNESTAAAVLGLWDNPTFASARSDMATEQGGFKDAGIDSRVMTMALYDKWPGTHLSSR